MSQGWYGTMHCGVCPAFFACCRRRPSRLQGPGCAPPSGRLRCRAFPAAVGGEVCSRGCSRSAVDQLVVVSLSGVIALLPFPLSSGDYAAVLGVSLRSPLPLAGGGSRVASLTAPAGRGSLRSPLASRRSLRSRLAVAARPWRSRFARPPAPRSRRGAPCLAVHFVHRSAHLRPPSGRPHGSRVVVPGGHSSRSLVPRPHFVRPRGSRLAITRCAPRLWLRCLRRLSRRAVGPFGSPIPLLCRSRPSRLHGPGRRRLPFGRRRRPGFRQGRALDLWGVDASGGVVVSSSVASWAGVSVSARPARRCRPSLAHGSRRSRVASLPARLEALLAVAPRGRRSRRGAPCLAVITARLNRGLPPVGLAGRASLRSRPTIPGVRALPAPLAPGPGCGFGASASPVRVLRTSPAATATDVVASRRTGNALAARSGRVGARGWLGPVAAALSLAPAKAGAKARARAQLPLVGDGRRTPAVKTRVVARERLCGIR